MAESVSGTQVRKHTFIHALILDIIFKEVKEATIFLSR